MENFAMVVVSCDHYTELGNIFFDLQKKYMGWFDAPVYFINESKPVSFPGVTAIHVGTDVDWSGKMQRALEKIPETYILFMLEDYFIGREVRREHLEQALQTMKTHDLRYYRITATPDIRKKSDLAPYLAPIPSNCRYGVNLQAAIFHRDYLKQIVNGPDRSAWETETDLLKTVTDRYEYDLPGCVLDRRNIIDIHNGVIKGKWVPSTLGYFQKQGYTIDLGSRQKLPFGTVLKIAVMNTAAGALPAAMARRLKKLLMRLGMKFVSEN